MAEALHKVENVGTFVDFLVWFAQTPEAIAEVTTFRHMLAQCLVDILLDYLQNVV